MQLDARYFRDERLMFFKEEVNRNWNSYREIFSKWKFITDLIQNKDVALENRLKRMAYAKACGKICLFMERFAAKGFLFLVQVCRI